MSLRNVPARRGRILGLIDARVFVIRNSGQNCISPSNRVILFYIGDVKLRWAIGRNST
jgi:hypothetical protein